MNEQKRTFTFFYLLLAVVIQIVWVVVTARGFESMASYPAIITLLFGSLLLTQGKFKWFNTFLRVVLGLILLLSVGDRFGFLGVNGTPGVSWGDFDHFVSYTSEVNSFLPSTWAFALALLATTAETALGLALVLGFYMKTATTGVAVLLGIFGFAMAISIGITSPFYYAVFVLSSASLKLSAIDNMALSLDGFLSGKDHAN